MTTHSSKSQNTIYRQNNQVVSKYPYHISLRLKPHFRVFTFETEQRQSGKHILVIADKTELLSDIINSPLYEFADGSSSQKATCPRPSPASHRSKVFTFIELNSITSFSSSSCMGRNGQWRSESYTVLLAGCLQIWFSS